MNTLPPHDQNNNPEVIIIPISKGQYALVDSDDADLATVKWFLCRDRYAMRRLPRIDGQSSSVLMHRVILERKLGRPILPNMVVDHINGDGLDNRRSNLREATYAENALNKEGRGIKRLIAPKVTSANYRLDNNDPNVALIPINYGKVVVVDLIDADLASFKWTLNCGRYANRRIEKNGKGKHISMHRVILERKLGRPIEQDMVVDHINGDGLDNRRDNLREVTQCQNLRNTKLRTDNTSKYKGVKKISEHTWEARIGSNYRAIGYFDTAEDASFAYDKAAIAQFGEFACLNNPIEQVLEWTPPIRQYGRKSISGYRGVRTYDNRWGASIVQNKKNYQLGFFDTPEEAAFAYDKTAFEIYGESAVLNHPIEQVLAWIPPARILRKTNSSGYRGVRQFSKTHWCAQIHGNGKVSYLGKFDTPEDAARAYDKAAIEIYGERAILNFPEENYGKA